jgi:hypothetical protein
LVFNFWSENFFSDGFIFCREEHLQFAAGKRSFRASFSIFSEPYALRLIYHFKKLEGEAVRR